MVWSKFGVPYVSYMYFFKVEILILSPIDRMPDGLAKQCYPTSSLSMIRVGPFFEFAADYGPEDLNDSNQSVILGCYLDGTPNKSAQ